MKPNVAHGFCLKPHGGETDFTSSRTQRFGIRRSSGGESSLESADVRSALQNESVF